MNDDQNDIVESLIVRSLTGEASTEDEKELAAWIAQSEQNRRHYLASKKALELTQNFYTRQTDEHSKINVDQEWKILLNRISTQKTPATYPSDAPVRLLIPETRTPRIWSRIAAAVLLLAVAAALINYFLWDTSVHYQTAENTLDVTLSDGSKIKLNRNSELSYSTHFGSRIRKVTLSGEVFFEVAPDPNRPFVVRAGDAEIEVLGTSFNVAGYESQKEIAVTVETGIVKLSASGSTREIKLHPGEKGVYSKINRQVHSQINDNINFLSWKTLKIELIASDLRNTIETINKAYGTHIIMNTDVPASCVVTVTFDHQSLEAVLQVLKATLNLTYRVQGDQIEITHAGC